MSLSRPTFLLSCCLLFSITLQAQQSPSTPTSVAISDPQAVALVQRSLAALTSGVAVIDVTLTGSAHRIAGSDDETGTVTLEASAAGDSRVDLSFASGNRIEIRNHSALPLPGTLPPGVPASAAQTPQPVGEWIGPDGAPHAMANHNIMTTAPWFFPALILEEVVTSQNCVLSYVGQETLNGQAVLDVSISQPLVITSGSEGSVSSAPPGVSIASLTQHLTQVDIYFDSRTSLPVGLAFNAHPDNNALIDIPTEITFSSYETVNGIAVPMTLQKYLNNGLVLELQFTNATLNSGLSTSAFALQ